MTKDLTRAPEIGQRAKADFLPPKIKELHAGRKNRHNLAIAALVVGTICASAVLALRGVEANSVSALRTAQAGAVRILNQQAAYSDMVSLIQESKNLSDAYVVVSERNVNWSQIVGRVANSIPSGGSLKSVELASTASSTAGVGEASGTMVNLNVTFESPSIAGVEFFLLDAQQWPGFKSAMVNQMTQRNGFYDATAQVHFDVTALSPGKPQGIKAH